MREKQTNTPIIHSVYLLCMVSPTCFGITLPSSRMCVLSSDVLRNTPIHNILSTAPQLSISQKAQGTFPEDGNVMPNHIGVTIHN
jgi:hypothetical protein